MKMLTIEVQGKKYLSSKISAYHSREALKIQKDSIQLAKKGKSLQEAVEVDGVNEAEELFDIMEDLAKRKTCLLCEIYENQFSADDLERDLAESEIDAAINGVLYGVNQTITKN